MDKNILLLIEMYPDLDTEFLEFLYNDFNKNYLNVIDFLCTSDNENNVFKNIENQRSFKESKKDNFDDIMSIKKSDHDNKLNKSLSESSSKYISFPLPPVNSYKNDSNKYEDNNEYDDCNENSSLLGVNENNKKNNMLSNITNSLGRLKINLSKKSDLKKD